jgi:hypothetical protein
MKNRQVAFRKRTPLEEVNYILRYCEYVRDIINEYVGVFSEHRLKGDSSNKAVSATFLNPRQLTFSDGTPYITEQDLPKAL